MSSLEKLIKHFERFPGIGARQARRFAHHLLTESDADVAELAELIGNIRAQVTPCASCFRFFARNGGGDCCSICADSARDRTKLMVVAADSDITSVERSGMYNGLYFVLGGTAPLLDTENAKKLRAGALKRIVEERQEALSEIILAFAVNPDGENTARFVESVVREIIDARNITCSQLGRGLSTGSELEYADPETIKNALANRSVGG
jgi:recombination protein RecR